jgi:hypothetical protein
MKTIFYYERKRWLMAIVVMCLALNSVIADNQVVRYSFATTSDDSGTYTGALDWGATLTTPKHGIYIIQGKKLFVK